MCVCREIARELQVNLLGYDYSGYGASTGQHSVPNVMADIEACYDWLVTQGTKPGSIIAYGQSVSPLPAMLPPPVCSVHQSHAPRRC